MGIRSALASTHRAMNAADIESLLDKIEYVSGSVSRKPAPAVTKEVEKLMRDFAKDAVAEGWHVEAAYEAFVELIDEENDGLEADHRLGIPKFRAFRAAFDAVRGPAASVH